MLKSVIAGSNSTCMFCFIKNCLNVFRVAVPFYILTNTVWWCTFSASSPVFGIITIFYFGHSDRCVVISHCGFNLHFLRISDVIQLFMWLFAICIFHLFRWNVYACLQGKYSLCFSSALLLLHSHLNTPLHNSSDTKPNGTKLCFLFYSHSQHFCDQRCVSFSSTPSNPQILLTPDGCPTI